MIIFGMSIEIAKLVKGLDFFYRTLLEKLLDPPPSMHHVSLFVLSYAHVAGYFN